MTAAAIVAITLVALAAGALLLAALIVLRPAPLAPHKGRHTARVVARRRREEQPEPTYAEQLRARIVAVQDAVELAAATWRVA